ncbi:MAG: hypothetical protein PHY47_00465 [Lachnospiraceae bacterium]|nr:hypothetical protein [Lachnospiraceae bacterium]
MATKIFDVKINVVYPHITKTIPAKDSERIQQTTFFKYEPQKSVAQPELLSAVATNEPESNNDRLARTNEELEEIKNDFIRMEEKANNAFKNYSYTYDIEDPRNEGIRNAEEAIFGVATGTITQAKYKKVLDLISAVDSKLVDLTVSNGGGLNVVG